MKHFMETNKNINDSFKKNAKQQSIQTVIDFQALKEFAQDRTLDILMAWLPDGRLTGKEYVSLNPRRDDVSEGSFKINVETGQWADFAIDDAGGDLISLIAYLEDLSQVEAAKKLQQFLKQPGSCEVPKPAKKTSPVWCPIVPIPDSATPPPSRHFELGAPSKSWRYVDSTGGLVCVVCRFETTTGKQFRPLTYCQNETGQTVWNWKGCPDPRPLYQLDKIASSPLAPVLVCEGEKAADAAQLLFPSWITTTSMNGSQSPEKTDWAPLAGRDVYIWPDADAPGKVYSEKVVELIRQIGPSTPIRVMTEFKWKIENGRVVDGFSAPVGWDAADALASGWTAAYIQALPSSMFSEIETVAPALEVPGYLIKDEGIYRQVLTKDDKPYLVWIASRIDVVALTRDSNNQNWGLLMNFKDSDGHVHEWAMPRELLSSSGDLYRQQLLSLGAAIASKAKDDLTQYFMMAKPTDRALCVETTGWHGNVFVLPHRTFGQSSERVLYQATETGKAVPYGTVGTLQEWKQNVGAKCVGNSRLILAVCVSLSGPFLDPLEHENGGLHLRGPSSSGKTKALSVAASIWGGRRMVRNWRTTGNAIESLAVEHNECVLILDELGQVDPQDAGDIAYTLGNGQSKARMNRFGNTRASSSWKLLFLSTGEIGLAEHVTSAGNQIRAGQEVRLLDIPSDAGRGLGLFENIHGAASSQAFADILQVESERYFGTAAEALLTKLTTSPEDLANAVATVKSWQARFVHENVQADAHGQVFRAAGRFGLIAAVGEYCTSIGVLPWALGEAMDGITKCFNAWLETRGGSQASEEVRALAQVRRFLELHGESRFTPVNQEGIEDNFSPRTIYRAGFSKSIEGDSKEYWVLPEVYRTELCRGLDPRLVTRVLLEAGILQRGTDEKATIPKRLPGIEGTSRVYIIRPSIFQIEEPLAA